MNMKATGIRMPDEVKARLRILALQESLRRGAEIRWTDLVREAVDKFLLARSDQPNPDPVASPAESAGTSSGECFQF
jgi:hypothetical protein